jgi:hypothetical protein
MRKKIITWFEKIYITGTGVMFQAVAPFKPLAPIDSQSGQLSGIYQSGDLSVYISKLFVFAISIGAIIAVIRLMWAGYQYMGSEMWTSKESAKKTFREVILGLLLLLAIYLILYRINPNLLNIQILTNITAKQSTGLTVPAGTPTQGTMACPNCSGTGSYCDQRTGVCLVRPN